MENIQVVILVGGLGTRLRPLTESVPKPMVEVDGKPFLEYVLKYFKKSGITDIVLCVGYLGHIVEEYFGDGSKWELNIKYSFDNQLGTAGAIKNAEHLLKDEFFVQNGDNFTDFDIEGVYNFHHKHPNDATIVVCPAYEPKDKEIVVVEGNIVKKFIKRDTPEHDEEIIKNKDPVVNSGAYLLTKKILASIPANKKVSIEAEIFPLHVGKMNAFRHEGHFYDIGTPSRLDKFRKEVNQFI